MILVTFSNFHFRLYDRKRRLLWKGERNERKQIIFQLKGSIKRNMIASWLAGMTEENEV